MFVVLIIISTVVLTNALEPINNEIIERGDEKAKEVIRKYIEKVPDIQEQYVIDERLSKAISHYFKGKMSAFPLYKVSVKIDRNPVKIPWTLDDPKLNVVKPRAQKKKNKQVKKRYKYEKIDKNKTETTSEKLLEISQITTPALSVITRAPIINTTL